MVWPAGERGKLQNSQGKISEKTLSTNIKIKQRLCLRYKGGGLESENMVGISIWAGGGSGGVGVGERTNWLIQFFMLSPLLWLFWYVARTVQSSLASLQDTQSCDRAKKLVCHLREGSVIEGVEQVPHSMLGLYFLYFHQGPFFLQLRVLNEITSFFKFCVPHISASVSWSSNPSFLSKFPHF